MANPTTRDELKKYCLRSLGAPVVEVNIDEDQMQDRIDDALAFYRDYHYDGAERVFLKHELTLEDITNQYLPVPEEVTAIIRIFDVGDSNSSVNMFDVRYQFHLNDLYNYLGRSIVPYDMAMQHLALLEEKFVGKQPIRFNRHTDKLHIDMAWDEVKVGDFIVIECYKYLDPSEYQSVWGDWWLRRYTTALFKRQWGENLKKFEGMQLPGGIQFNGQKIWEEAIEEIRKLEDEVINNFSLPVSDMIG